MLAAAVPYTHSHYNKLHLHVTLATHEYQAYLGLIQNELMNKYLMLRNVDEKKVLHSQPSTAS